MSRRHKKKKKPQTFINIGEAPKKVFTIGKAEIWAGGRDKVIKQPGWVFALNCAGPMGYPHGGHKGIPVFTIDWPDGNVPKFPINWNAIVELIASQEGRVVIYCQGGHGRTGTALSIIAGLTITEGDPVKFVRDHYVQSAVETKEQIAYIEKITGLEVKEAESFYDLWTYDWMDYITPSKETDDGPYIVHVSVEGKVFEWEAPVYPTIAMIKAACPNFNLKDDWWTAHSVKSMTPKKWECVYTSKDHEVRWQVSQRHEPTNDEMLKHLIENNIDFSEGGDFDVKEAA